MKILAMIILAGLMLLLSVRAAEVRRPNIVFLLTDDQPRRAMGHVDEWFHTPHMGRLAEQSIGHITSTCHFSPSSYLRDLFASPCSRRKSPFTHRLQRFSAVRGCTPSNLAISAVVT